MAHYWKCTVKSSVHQLCPTWADECDCMKYSEISLICTLHTTRVGVCRLSSIQQQRRKEEGCGRGSGKGLKILVPAFVNKTNKTATETQFPVKSMEVVNRQLSIGVCCHTTATLMASKLTLCQAKTHLKSAVRVNRKTHRIPMPQRYWDAVWHQCQVHDVFLKVAYKTDSTAHKNN